MSEEIEELEIDLMLEAIYRVKGFDFRQYLRSSLRRRILHRMQLDHVPTVSALLDRILHDEQWMNKLLEDLSIKVTEMFRDPGFFLAFRKFVVPHLRMQEQIRIWHAGCATGEEVYSMAILLDEEGLLDRTIIYATDMSKDAIDGAKAGRFPLKKMQAYTRNYLQAGGKGEFSSYYCTNRTHAYFHDTIKQRMVFAQHNLATDGSFNEFHAILCRNVLIYFDTELQNRVFNVLADSLTYDGYLALGCKETILAAQQKRFVEDQPEWRIYRKYANG
ncbi:CheR family methyltransferase [Paenibacillus chungangensis]|uniref:CheR family methyltransferase n=1 Tax=Paenibacillus chungangensis TaxID=696535 RepID=A0ABW3HXF0_9BACL